MCPTKFNKLNSVQYFATTKYPPNWCCTISHEGTCRCNTPGICTRNIFMCTCCDFVPATPPHYTFCYMSPPQCALQKFFVAATCPCKTTPRVIREFTQPRRRRQQERHKFACLTVKNNRFARFARAVFIFGHSADVLVLSAT